MTTVYIALGANLDNPVQQLQDALQALRLLATDNRVTASPFYCSAPMGDVPQPDYINAVARFETSLTPLDLLDELQAIERRQGRQRAVRWGARTLDLDLLLFGQQTIVHPRLTVPHYGIKQRSFVLIPLADLDDSLTLPCGNNMSHLILPEMRQELQQVKRDH